MSRVLLWLMDAPAWVFIALLWGSASLLAVGLCMAAKAADEFLAGRATPASGSPASRPPGTLNRIK